MPARVAGDPLPLLRSPCKAVSFLMVGTVQNQLCSCRHRSCLSGAPGILSLLFPAPLTWGIPGAAFSHLYSFLFGNAQAWGLAALQGHCQGPSFPAQPHSLPTLDPQVVPSAGCAEARESGRMTGFHCCLCSRHSLSRLDAAGPKQPPGDSKRR